MIPVRMRRDDVFENAVRAIFVDVRSCRIRAACTGPSIDEDVRVARFDIDRIARVFVPQFHKMDGQITADIGVAARRALYVSIQEKRRRKTDDKGEKTGDKGDADGKFLFSHSENPPPLPGRPQ